MTNPLTPSRPPVLLHGAAARRALRHAIALLLLASIVPVANAAVSLGYLYGVTWPPRTGHYIGVMRVCVAIVLFFWLPWVVIGRTTLDRVTPRRRLAQRGAAVACGSAALFAADPSVAFTPLAMIIFWGTFAWLTLEVCRSHGIVLEHPRGETDPRHRRAHTWALSQSAFNYCAAGPFVAFLGMQVLRVLDVDVLPVMGDQLAVLGIKGDLGLTLGAVTSTVVLEDIVIVAAVAALMTAARRPVWQIYTTICVVEVLVHAYFGLPALAMAIFAAGRLQIFLYYGRVVPLMIAHATFDLIGTLLKPVPLPYRIAAACVLAIALPMIEKRSTGAADAEEQADPNPAAHPDEPPARDRANSVSSPANDS
ncbi:hypothetical protein ACFWZ2_37380 [Streptomyces sp. NPDC059002]|uniref:hypothetical protein n=1 Tax=Streptomyces sp. NPDC059002 TaxID=3346690 RepID=UPI0036871684